MILINRVLLLFLLVTAFVYWWVDSFIRVYPAYLSIPLQTILVWLLINKLSKHKWHFLVVLVISAVIGWVVSIITHNLLSLVYYDNFVLSITEHYQSQKLLKHLWFMCWSSLVTLGVIQALVLTFLLRCNIHKKP